MMRSPFLPAILVQSSALVVLGSSSFALSSSPRRPAGPPMARPFSAPAMPRLRASVLACHTMDSEGALTTEERAELGRLQRENRRGLALLGGDFRSPLALFRRPGDERAHHGYPHPRRPRPGPGAAAPTPGPGASFGSGSQYASGDSTTRRGPPRSGAHRVVRTPSSATMGSGGIRRLAISVRERSSDGTNWTRRQLNAGVDRPEQVQPSEGSLAPEKPSSEPDRSPELGFGAPASSRQSGHWTSAADERASPLPR